MRFREHSLLTILLLPLVSAVFVLGAGGCENFSSRNVKPDSGTALDVREATDVSVGNDRGPGAGGTGPGTGGTGPGTGGTGPGTGGAGMVGTGGQAGGITGSGGAVGGGKDGGLPDAPGTDSGVSGECTPGAKQCNGLQPQVCDGSGTWKSMGTPCPFVCSNTTGACAGVCTPGAKQCSTLQPQVCSAAGAWQNVGTACPFVCSPATATCSGTCVPGAKQCMGSLPQVCDVAGTWQSSGAACGACDPCSASTGTCVPSPGAICNDGKMCTSNTTCQADGTCGGGTTTTCTNPCKVGMTCQEPAGTCGGGTNVAKNTTCGSGKVCDGTGNCACRTKSSWNLLNNPGFNGAADWVLEGVASYDGATDVDSCMGSGSVLVPGSFDSVSQCLVLPSELMGSARTFFFGYRSKPSGASGGSATCNLIFYGGIDGCQGSSLSSGTVEGLYSSTNWIQVVGSAGSTADSTHFRVTCSAFLGSGYYDQIFVSTSSQAPGAF